MCSVCCVVKLKYIISCYAKARFSLAHKDKHKHMCKASERSTKHKHKKNGQVRSSCAGGYSYVVALTSENWVDISTSISTRPWTNHRSFWLTPHKRYGGRFVRHLVYHRVEELVLRIESKWKAGLSGEGNEDGSRTLACPRLSDSIVRGVWHLQTADCRSQIAGCKLNDTKNLPNKGDVIKNITSCESEKVAWEQGWYFCAKLHWPHSQDAVGYSSSTLSQLT